LIVAVHWIVGNINVHIFLPTGKVGNNTGQIIRLWICVTS